LMCPTISGAQSGITSMSAKHAIGT
jgi:hypothetical protein